MPSSTRMSAGQATPGIRNSAASYEPSLGCQPSGMNSKFHLSDPVTGTVGIGIFICRDLDYALRLCAYIKRSCRTVDMRLRLSGRQSHDSGKDRNHEVDRIPRDSTSDAEGDCK